MLSTAFFLAASMVVGQAKEAIPMPPELVKQVNETLIGEWTLQATHGDVTFTGEEEWTWSKDNICIHFKGFLKAETKQTSYSGVMGWDGINRALVGHMFNSNGEGGTIRWTEFGEKQWSGTWTGTYEGKETKTPAKLEFTKEYSRYEDVTNGLPWVSIARRKPAAAAVGQTDGEVAFKSWFDFSLGGTWSTTVDGATSTMSYKRTLNGRFVQANLVSDGTRVKFLVGIDPVTKKCTWWGYDEDGCVVKWVMSKLSEDVWMSEGEGMGPEGKCALKEKITRIDENSVKEEIEYFMINGEQRKAITTIWKREAGKE